MLSYCLNCTARSLRIMLLSKCAVYNRKKSKFIKQQGASGLSGSLRLKTPLSKSPLVGPLLF